MEAPTAKKTDNAVSLSAHGDRVIVAELPLDPKASRDKGLFATNYRIGRVITVGRGTLEDGQWVAPEVEAGETVLFRANPGNEENSIFIDGTQHFVIEEYDLVATLSK